MVKDAITGEYYLSGKEKLLIIIGSLIMIALAYIIFNVLVI